MFHQNYDMILVPGLAYDADGYRIGYGEGYYDSFMIQHPNTIKIGVFYLFQ
ncbi:MULTISPECIES: 5-formyltetrahydrofolate cyclo-ligase [unclassified Allomuricauda]|uniref:5-formyltetrahydrofolate cyclo-ligase n=1 Tax=unclassified Allomuricauda TaxID=2615049 RepID=UPI00273F6718|nr:MULTISPECIES: 5-formyltetrahydrofolate cyclo-ligase [unclassified Allomuricauda]